MPCKGSSGHPRRRRPISRRGTDDGPIAEPTLSTLRASACVRTAGISTCLQNPKGIPFQAYTSGAFGLSTHSCSLTTRILNPSARFSFSSLRTHCSCIRLPRRTPNMSLPFDPYFYLKWNLGVVLSGLAITGAIFGVSCAQLSVYARHYWGEDRSLLKTIVTCVWSLDCLHLALYTYTIYHFLVFKHADFIGQLQLPWTSNAQLVINTTLVALVQLFYVLRVWSLCKYIAVISWLVIMVAACWATGILLVVKSATAESVADITTLGNYVIASNALIAGTDIAITVTLVLLLYTSRVSGSRSKRLITRLIFYTINTGIMTSVCALLALVTNLTNRDKNLYILFSYVGASLYAVSMIASLNAREGLRNHMAGASGITTMPTIGTTTSRLGEGSKHAVRLPPEVFIETSVETTRH
ncbi:hypothetical protein C8Q76DRAFT_741557 [Earliella scabrosa]|nr:hypothetical protein C8Q76DRAFT_741557 [Earliella scabrosa]